jgi:hypothetical protein
VDTRANRRAVHTKIVKNSEIAARFDHLQRRDWDSINDRDRFNRVNDQGFGSVVAGESGGNLFLKLRV